MTVTSRQFFKLPYYNNYEVEILYDEIHNTKNQRRDSSINILCTMGRQKQCASWDTKHKEWVSWIPEKYFISWIPDRIVEHRGTVLK